MDGVFLLEKNNHTDDTRRGEQRAKNKMTKMLWNRNEENEARTKREK
jgi:hypothetical protein